MINVDIDEMQLLEKIKGPPHKLCIRYVCVCWGWGAGGGLYTVLTRPSVRMSIRYGLVPASRNLLMFCINADIDEMLLLEKNKDTGINSVRVISRC